jgi:hypothetical protein
VFVERSRIHVHAPAEGGIAATIGEETDERDRLFGAFREQRGAKDYAAVGIDGEGGREEGGELDRPRPRLRERDPAVLAEAAVDAAVGAEPVEDVALLEVAGDQKLARGQDPDLGEAGVPAVAAATGRRDPQTPVVAEGAVDSPVGAVGDHHGARAPWAAGGAVGRGDDVTDTDDRPVGLDRQVVEAFATAFRLDRPAFEGRPRCHLPVAAKAPVEPPFDREPGQGGCNVPVFS